MQQPLGKAIAHIDMDAFYAQVEVRQHPQLRGMPVGVVQYNPYGDLASHAADEDRVVPASNGSLIAVSYEARAAGVKRNMRGDQARGACPEIQLVQVPTAHGKADLTVYRGEGSKVLEILGRMGRTERASIDEAYVDLTAEAQRRLEQCGGVPPLPANPDQVHVMQEAGFQGAAAWWHRPPEAWRPGERLLACAAAAVADLRAAVAAELGYTCSAGVAHTKLMAKLLHKPAQQTVLPAGAVPALLGPLPIPKLRGLGGTMGEQVMGKLGIETVGQLAATPLPRLEAAFGEKDAQWLYGLARGVTDDAVEERKLPKSLNCGKTFRGRQALRDLPDVHKWLLELGGELAERLDAQRQEHGRIPQLLTVTFAASLPWQAKQGGGFEAAPGYHSHSRSCPLRKWNDPAAIADDALALVRRWAAEQGAGWQVSSLFITAGSFVPVQSAAAAITRFFKPAAAVAGRAEGAAAAEGAASKAEGDTHAHAPAVQQPQQPQPQPQQPPQQQQQQQAGSSSARQQPPQQQPPQQQGQGGTGPCQPREQAGGSSARQQPPQQQPPPQQGQGDTGPCQPREQAGGSSARQQPTLQQQQRQQRSLSPQAAAATASAAGPSASRPAGQALPRGLYQQQPVDETVLAELPQELQREIRAQMEAERLAAHFHKPRPQGAGGGGKKAGGGKRAGSSSGGDSQPTLAAFLKGKRPKR